MLFVEVVDVRGQVRRKKTKTDGCLFTGLVPTKRLLRLLVRCLLRILMVRLHDCCGMDVGWVLCCLRLLFCFLCCVEGLPLMFV